MRWSSHLGSLRRKWINPTQLKRLHQLEMIERKRKNQIYIYISVSSLSLSLGRACLLLSLLPTVATNHKVIATRFLCNIAARQFKKGLDICRHKELLHVCLKNIYLYMCVYYFGSSPWMCKPPSSTMHLPISNPWNIYYQVHKSNGTVCPFDYAKVNNSKHSMFDTMLLLKLSLSSSCVWPKVLMAFLV